MKKLLARRIWCLSLVFCVAVSISPLCIGGALAQTSVYQHEKVVWRDQEFEIMWKSNDGSIAGMVDNSALHWDVLSPSDGYFEVILPMSLVKSVFALPSEQSYLRSIFVEVDGNEYTNGRNDDVFNATSSSCDNFILKTKFGSGRHDIEFKIVSLLGGGGQGPLPANEPVNPTVVIPEGNFTLDVKTNADKCNFSLIKEEKKLHIVVEHSDDRKGYMEVTIPHTLLGGNYSVWTDGQETKDFSSDFSQNSTTLILEYGVETKSIDIVGTTVIPEFSSLLIAVPAAFIIGLIILSNAKGRTGVFRS